jgi:regulator of cell morphogenesis and NO signaling
MSLKDACNKLNIDVKNITEKLQEFDNDNAKSNANLDLTKLNIKELSDNIYNYHHKYLHNEMPEIMKMSNEVIKIYSSKNPALIELNNFLGDMFENLKDHLNKEE